MATANQLWRNEKAGKRGSKRSLRWRQGPGWGGWAEGAAGPQVTQAGPLSRRPFVRRLPRRSHHPHYSVLKGKSLGLRREPSARGHGLLARRGQRCSEPMSPVVSPSPHTPEVQTPQRKEMHFYEDGAEVQGEACILRKGPQVLRACLGPPLWALSPET